MKLRQLANRYLLAASAAVTLAVSAGSAFAQAKELAIPHRRLCT